MDESGKKLLELMFRPGESICVSHNKYGFHSIRLEAMFQQEPITQILPEESCEKLGISWEEGQEKRFPGEMLLCALNPIRGYRTDENCTAYRNFLVEMDDGSLKEQFAYINKIGLPYSACVFSGGKSLHFLISLATDLPDEKTWRYLAEWILKIANLADDKTKNPSRSIRIPGAWRTTKSQQRLVEIKPAITLTQLRDWLTAHPDAKPGLHAKRTPSERPDLGQVKPWVKAALYNGIDRQKGRNQQWYAIAYEFTLAGFSEDDILDRLLPYFTPERDFKEREWKRTIRSAFKNASRK